MDVIPVLPGTPDAGNVECSRLVFIFGRTIRNAFITGKKQVAAFFSYKN